MILLDTHVLLWSADDDPRLGKAARALLADDDRSFGYSAITAWELAMLAAKNKVQLPMAPDRLLARVRAIGVNEIAVVGAIGLDAGGLKDMHGDPADRIIVATARVQDCALLTADEKILRYAAAGHVQAIDARA